MFFLLFIAITYYKILQIICILQPFNDHIPYFDLFSQPPFWRQIPQCYHSFLLLVHHDFYRTIILRHQLRMNSRHAPQGGIASPFQFTAMTRRIASSPFVIILKIALRSAHTPSVHAVSMQTRHKFCRKPTLPLTHRLFFIGTIIALSSAT